MAILRQRTPRGVQPHFFLLGDFNVQPSSLGGGADSRPKRDTSLQRFLDDFNMVLANPPLHGESRSKIVLPIRDVEVSVRTGDTHHGCGHGLSRSIDLCLSSAHSPFSVIVHNILHCKGVCGCSWSNCADFCKSDHFLVEAIAELGMSPASGGRAIFPREWHDSSRWSSAFGHVIVCLIDLDAVAFELRSWSREAFGHGRATGLQAYCN